jgi:hypothetical protein
VRGPRQPPLIEPDVRFPSSGSPTVFTGLLSRSGHSEQSVRPSQPASGPSLLEQQGTLAGTTPIPGSATAAPSMSEVDRLAAFGPPQPASAHARDRGRGRARTLVARARIAATPQADQTEVVEADAPADRLSTGHAVVLVANLARLFSPDNKRRLLERLREVAESGTRLLPVDFWTDPRTDSPSAVLMAGEFALLARKASPVRPTSGSGSRDWSDGGRHQLTGYDRKGKLSPQSD